MIVEQVRCFKDVENTVFLKPTRDFKGGHFYCHSLKCEHVTFLYVFYISCIIKWILKLEHEKMIIVVTLSVAALWRVWWTTEKMRELVWERHTEMKDVIVWGYKAWHTVNVSELTCEHHVVKNSWGTKQIKTLGRTKALMRQKEMGCRATVEE